MRHQLLESVRGHWGAGNGLRFENDRWWDEARHACRRPGRAERFTILVSTTITALQAPRPEGTNEPIRAQAGALNGDIGRTISLMTRPA